MRNNIKKLLLLSITILTLSSCSSRDKELEEMARKQAGSQGRIDSSHKNTDQLFREMF